MSATGLYRAIRVAWINPTVADLSYTEIWASQTNDRATATRKAVPASVSGTSQFWLHENLTPGAVWYYWIRSGDTSSNLSGFLPSSATAGWTATVITTIVSTDLPAASETVSGVLEIATQAETDAGTDDQRALTPLKAKFNAALVPTTRTVTTNPPLTGGGDLSTNRTFDITLATETADGSIELATQAETNTGTDDARAVTPLKLKTNLTTPPALGATTPNTVKGTTVTATTAFELPIYTVAGVPLATTGWLIYVSNEVGGAVPAFSDGTNWRRVTDRAIIASA